MNNKESGEAVADLPETLTTEQRARILREVINVKGAQMSIAKALFDAKEFLNTFSDCSTAELKALWQEWVGEWLLSRQDMPPEDYYPDPEHMEMDVFAAEACIWLDTQWNRLLNNEPRDYGFNHLDVDVGEIKAILEDENPVPEGPPTEHPA